MTEEERKLALYCLKASSDYHSEVCEECINYPNCDHTIQDDVTETIIKALEQEPCEDAISRQAVLAIAGDSCLDLDSYEDTKEFCDEINDLPPVTPKQEPCEDCISREELLKAIDTWDKFGCDADNKLIPVKDCYVPYIHYDDVVKCVKGLPSVNPKSKTRHWIPVSERLPEEGRKIYLTCFQDGYIASIMLGSDGKWLIEEEEPIAWMPLPEPYKEESEE